MPKEESSRANNVGCLLFAVVAIGLVLGGGMWLGKRDYAAKTPCERYADVANRVLYNCHSGLANDVEHHTAMCEQYLVPGPACLERLEDLSCDELRVPPEVSTGAACRARVN